MTGKAGMSERWLRGSCLCQAVAYEVADRFRYAAYCHCARCRARTGSAFSVFGGIEPDRFVVTRGTDLLTIYESINVYNRFCSRCGSQLYCLFKNGEMVHVQLGTLIDSPSIRPTEHIFAASNADWHEIADQLPQHERYAP